MKKIISFAVSLASAICILAICAFTAFAAGITESENNDSYDKADVLYSGDSVSGSLSSRDDKDYYKLTLNKKGYIAIDFLNPVLTGSSAQWCISVYKETDSFERINSFYVDTKQEKTALPKVGADAGVYYIVVTDNNYGYSSGIKYTLKPVFSETEYWETEFNDVYTDADKMVFGQKYSGHIHERARGDFYELNVVKNGYVTITFTNPVITSSSAQWAVRVYRYDDELQEIQFFTATPQNAKTTLPKIGVEPGVYYIKVSDNNYGYSCNIEYGIKADFTATDYRETELNDSYDNADKMVTGEKYIGHIHNSKAADWYELNIPEKGYIGITFSNPVLTSSSAEWSITVYRYADELQEIQFYTVRPVNASASLPFIGVEPGTYYIKISDNNYGYSEDIEYGLKASYVKTDYWETENNDNYSVADKMEANKEYGGHIHRRDRSDYYELTVKNKGYYTITFKTPVLQANSGEWCISVYRFDESLQLIQEYYAKPTKAIWTLPAIGVEPGVYYIEVRDVNYGYACNVTYSLRADYVKSDYWETELNNDYSTADKMEAGKEYGGHIHRRDRSDYYELTVKDKGYYRITFQNPLIQSNSGEWRINVYKFDESLQLIQEYYVKPTKTTWSLPAIGVEPGAYYIEVCDNNYGYICNVTYSLKADYVKSNYWESEFNDNYSQAEKIISGKKYGGHIYNRKTSDYYELKLTGWNDLKITFEHAVLTQSSARWKITLYKFNNGLEKLGEFYSKADEGKVIAEASLGAGIYYIQVEDDNYGYGCNVEYGLTVSGAGDVLPGDVNLDGQITAADARLALRASVRLEALSDIQLLAADVDGKAGITAADARLILRASVGLEKL